MEITTFLIEVVKYTDGWVIVIVFALFVGYNLYKKYSEQKVLNKTVTILDGTIRTLLERIDKSIKALTFRIDQFISRIREG